MDTVIFEPELIEYAFVGVSLSDAKYMGGEYSNESGNWIYQSFPLVNASKEHVLNYFAL